jgi:hypothetical protein
MGADQEALSTWATACAEVSRPDSSTHEWSRLRWERELRSLAALREIDEEVSIGRAASENAIRLSIRRDDPWLTLLFRA